MPADSLARVKRSAKRAASAMKERNDAIAQAHAEGHSLRQIADAAGISHVRVLKILRGE